ncbi:hypothetical protein ACLHDF_04760 [Priestia aryabhattai]|uniref:hypothetical protein n=1 Tax=Priestia megaterium TaxID=1404 RepID=UPI0039B9B249
MKYKEAQAKLQKVFDHQQTVSVPKLKRLFQSLNISVKKSLGNSNREVSYLKGEISKLEKENKRLREGGGNPAITIMYEEMVCKVRDH